MNAMRRHFATAILVAVPAAQRASDALILLPGGPGQTFTDAAADGAAGHADLRRTRDILLVDVRGVGRSNALDCDVPYPDGLSSRFGTVFPPTHVAACRDSLGTRANLSGALQIVAPGSGHGVGGPCLRAVTSR